MGKPKYELPSATFPYKISKRLCLLSIPRRVIVDTGEGMPAVSPITGVRKSALRGQASDRVNEAAYPYIRRLIMTRKAYKSKFSADRLEKLDRLIESCNTTIYTKIANAVIDLRKQLLGIETSKDKKKRGWSDSDWKKHMDYINMIASPKPEFPPPPLTRGETKPLNELLPRINGLAQAPEYKVYRRMSQEDWYRDPTKVPKSALTYQITDHIKKLATPRAVPIAD